MRTHHEEARSVEYLVATSAALGLENPFLKVQATSGTTTVGESAVNQLKGCLNDGEQGVVVALGRFTAGALTAARSWGNLTLIDGTRFVELFLGHYDKLEPEWRSPFQLRQVFVRVK